MRRRLLRRSPAAGPGRMRSGQTGCGPDSGSGLRARGAGMGLKLSARLPIIKRKCDVSIGRLCGAARVADAQKAHESVR